MFNAVLKNGYPVAYKLFEGLCFLLQRFQVGLGFAWIEKWEREILGGIHPRDRKSTTKLFEYEPGKCKCYYRDVVLRYCVYYTIIYSYIYR